MVRLSALAPGAADNLRSLPMPVFETLAWTPAPPVREARVAIISTAGLHRRGDTTFAGGASDYRIIPGDLDPADLLMSHVSTNFDRSGFQQDSEIAFPLGRLKELAAAGEIASVASWHYSFMGATDPTRMEETGRQVGRLLKEDGVNVALLVPV